MLQVDELVRLMNGTGHADRAGAERDRWDAGMFVQDEGVLLHAGDRDGLSMHLRLDTVAQVTDERQRRINQPGLEPRLTIRQVVQGNVVTKRRADCGSSHRQYSAASSSGSM